MLLQVTPSGSIGKQVFSASEQASLKGVVFTPSGAHAHLTIRDGNASGEVVFSARAFSGEVTPPTYKVCHKFTKGMHVEVVGANAAAYLVLE